MALNLHLDYINRTMTPQEEQLMESFKRMNSDCQSKVSYVSLDTSQMYHGINGHEMEELPENKARADELRAFVRETLKSELESAKMNEKLSKRPDNLVKRDSLMPGKSYKPSATPVKKK